jgi:16S rRNA (cytosine1402-N4)-methyltransferase
MMHIPVLLKEVIEGLDPKEGQNFIDCTLGEGGHSLEILKKILPSGKLLGIDFDLRNINLAKELFKNSGIEDSNYILVNDNFKNLKDIVEQNKFKNISGILFDLGLNSYFLDESERGFSFRFDEFLDMRFDQKTSLTAHDIVNKFPKTELENILLNLGEETFHKQIAAEIIKTRKNQEIKTTYDLNEIIYRSTPR